MKISDYHIPDLPDGTSVVQVDANYINDYDHRPELLVCSSDNNEKKIQKKLSKIFKDTVKITVVMISITEAASSMFNFMDKSYKTIEDEIRGKVKNMSNNVLFISDLKTWYKNAKKHRLLLTKLLSSPIQWNTFILDSCKSYGTRAVFLLNCMKANVIMTNTDTTNMTNGLLINKNFIDSFYESGVLQSESNFTLTERNDEEYHPMIFDSEKYVNLNFDLRGMDIKEATTHFIEHGWVKERRSFYYPDLVCDIQKPITSTKKRIVLMNHSNTLTGAPWVIFNLFIELLNDERVDVYMLTPSLNVNLAKKVKLKDHNYHVISFHNNPDFIRSVVNVIEPDYLVVNSFASEFLNLTDVFSNFHTIQYVHEEYKHYIPHQVSLDIDSKRILCVDHKTKKTFSKKDRETTIYPPKFRRSTFDEISVLQPAYTLVDMWTLAKWSMRKVIGMVGTPCQRKNYELFVKLARFTPQYEFVWVGGKRSFTDGNLTVIEKTQYATSYIALFDIFFLSSDEDLCPVVLLEALALNVQSMVFNKNIGFKHGRSQHVNKFNRNINDLSITSLQRKIEKVLNKEVDLDLPTGSQYIKENFIYEPGEFFDLIDNN